VTSIMRLTSILKCCFHRSIAMMRGERANSNYRLRVKLFLLGAFCSIFLTFESTSPSGISKTDADNCVKCHIQATGRAAEVVGIHRASTHGKIDISCNGCHGGDPEQIDKLKAHTGRFIGKPERTALLMMCGNCHERQLDQFKTSRHFPESGGIPRLDCADCHGAHSIGNPPESFSFAQYCASCHGLEYLPPLAQPLQDLVALTDELNDKMKRFSAKRGNLPDDFIEQRKEIRRLTAEIVHPTGNGGGIEVIGKVLSEGEKLKRDIGSR
jgi:nitrate/TMAO reductase-like tetraheme cytochrome c subunit